MDTERRRQACVIKVALMGPLPILRGEVGLLLLLRGFHHWRSSQLFMSPSQDDNETEDNVLSFVGRYPV